ncbi:MAG: TRAP transporter substrate-binding protein [Hyphomicrobiales bacterium]|nr:TRAP transporter substrate-binding protein [Hyphomicrobiales bacterium]MCP5370304.1 TRAP transporter substrate-binding protein [Hyphomicrobiales bacterium]
MLTKLSKIAAAGVLAASMVVAAAQAQAQEWKVGTPVPPKNIMATFINAVINGVAEKTGGAFKIDYYHNFNEQALTEQLVRGRIQMAYVSATGVGVTVPEAAVLNVPFLWNSDEERNYVTDKYVAPMLAEILDKRGITLVRVGEAGWTSLFCKTDACVDADVFQGMKARVSPNAAGKYFWAALGTNGVTLPLPDTWTALQTGVVDTGDLTFGFYLVTPAAKSAPHYVFTQHSHQPAFFLANKQAWAGLDAAAQKQVLDSMPSTMDMRETIRQDNIAKEKQFLANGGHTYHLTKAQLDKFKGKVVPGVPKLVADYGGRALEMYEVIEKGKKEFAAKTN